MNRESVESPITLEVNGVVHRVPVAPEQTLIDILRGTLGLTGTKQGCDDGACGTCMVILDGAAARACRVSAARAAGKRIHTIEGLGTAARLHPLQQAFIDADAVQCGFCTPGAIMAAKALLDRNPAPTRAQIREALAGNLCRCTGYTQIFEAVELAIAESLGVAPAARAWEAPLAESRAKRGES